MKTGAIVYIAGGENLDNFDEEKAVKKLNIKADRVEIVSSGSAHFDIMDAWWFLTAKGMKQIICMTATIKKQSELVLTGRELRLCG